MKKITDIDKNFAVSIDVDINDMDIYSAEQEPFELYGVFREGDKFRRMPENVAKSVSEGVYSLHTNTAGGRIRFATDSEFIYIKARTGKSFNFAHLTALARKGFDLLVEEEDGEHYEDAFIPPAEAVDEYEAKATIVGEKKIRQLTINFPLYSDVESLYIGVKKGSVIKEGKKYKNEIPVVYYGSSITQGGCASRPSNSYQAVISRRQNIHYINLGFSGSALAEDEMIDYINSLDMSVFVYDYDHNAPSAEHLKKTHKKMFDAVRENTQTFRLSL